MARATVRKAVRPKQAVSTNRSAFEIIPRGSEIVIESSEAIDERALAAGLRFAGGRHRPELSHAGRRVIVRVDDSFPPGRNTLYLSDLYTPAGRRIEVDLELPFFVCSTEASLPTDVRIESYQHVVVDDGTIRRASSPDGRGYALFKGTRRDGRARWEGAFDQAGKPVDFEQVRAEVIKARLAKCGKLHPSLLQRMERGGAEPISVAIWLRADLGGRPDKPSRGAIKEPLRAEVNARKRFAELARGFAEKNQMYERDRKLRVDPIAPVVYAELDAREISRLAASDEVSALFLYEREGIDDLTDSMNIAQAGDAHALGYNGSGVNVAVYENGPDITSNLQITARFKNNPTTSQHARHTHGIIKNVERNKPHGHAPDCRLHSANDKDLDAIRWAALDRGCTVISQSFHRESEQTLPIVVGSIARLAAAAAERRRCAACGRAVPRDHPLVVFLARVLTWSGRR